MRHNLSRFSVDRSGNNMDYRKLEGRAILVASGAFLLCYSVDSFGGLLCLVALYVVVQFIDKLAVGSAYVARPTLNHRFFNIVIDWIWNGFRSPDTKR